MNSKVRCGYWCFSAEINEWCILGGETRGMRNSHNCSSPCLWLAVAVWEPFLKKYRFIIYFNRVDLLAFMLYKKLFKVLHSMLKLETSNGSITLLMLTYCYFIDKKYQVLIKLIKYRYCLFPSLLKQKGNFFRPFRSKHCADCQGTARELMRCSRWSRR